MKRSSLFPRWAVPVIPVLLMLCVCGKDGLKMGELTPEEQFAHAKLIFEKKDYYKAKMQFTVLVLNNPGSTVIEDGQYYLAECHLELKEYLMAISEYEKLIKSLPQSKYVDDSRYKMGLCYEKLSPGYGLDQEYTNKAISQYQQFVEEYPASILRPVVEKHLADCVDKLARKEFKTGDLYRKIGYNNAAVISFDAVLENFGDTQYADDALFWKGFCQQRMKDPAAARSTFAALIQRFPESPWAEKAKVRMKDIQ